MVAPTFGDLHLTGEAISRQYINKGYNAVLYCTVLHQHHRSDVLKTLAAGDRRSVLRRIGGAIVDYPRSSIHLAAAKVFGQITVGWPAENGSSGTQACVTGSLEGSSVNGS